MSLNVDISQLLKTYQSMKQELNSNGSPRNIVSLKEANEQLLLREVQLKSVIEISEQLISCIEASQKQTKFQKLSKDSDYKPNNSEKLKVTEDALKRSKSEILNLRAEILKLETTQGSNNLFTVEVYQSEIEDIKKEYNEKISDLESIF